MSYAERAMQEPGEKQFTERRDPHYYDLKALVNPDYDRQTWSLVEQLQKGQITKEEAHDSFMQMLIETASIDTKTGLNKKEAVMIKLSRLMEYSGNQDIPLTVVYMDADNFRKINNEISHDAGDRAIIAIAEAIKEATRDSDIQGRLSEEIQEQPKSNGNESHARMGGDEFTLILPDATEEEALLVLARFRANLLQLANTKVPEYQVKFGTPLTVSCGVAQYNPKVDPTSSDLINRAEIAMKQSKKEGYGEVKIAKSIEIPDLSTPETFEDWLAKNVQDEIKQQRYKDMVELWREKAVSEQEIAQRLQQDLISN